MNYGLLMPCRLVQVIDATHYAVALAGQVEIEIHLMEVRLNGITAPKVIDQIEASLKAERRLACWLPVPEHDRGWFLGLRPGCSFAGDLILASESLTQKLASKAILVRLGAVVEWRGEEWVRTWSL
jgi:hypothetical protein